MTDQIWTRQKGERSKAFHLFCIYRDLGPTRSIEKVRLKFGESKGESISSTQLEKYSSNNNWVERSEAYDDYVDERQREKNINAIENMNERQAEDAVLIQKEALDDLQDATEDERSMASLESRKNAAARTWKIGVDAERLARGVATEKVEQSGTIKQRHSGSIDTANSLMKDPKYIQAKRKAMDEYYASSKGKE
ncbi:hypothetical protein [Methanobacterium paludis]|uniref:Uncharacterized protein n=1 Tax=Methanobacterium paludis (strain DSM 25820 / JCM 18151 / SWAN1) TaxID=868131 RepID=F6D2S6_METPW|nr:hypothetical protein [Methanobacterium paludis]AEG18655.1 hypothetical protein MSWAN_1644 [Methanobacterium paludis]